MTYDDERGLPIEGEQQPPRTSLRATPPPEQWDDVSEYDPLAWPRRVERRVLLMPTVCASCDAGCGLLAAVDRDSRHVHRVEGNPLHPGSRGRTCPIGPAHVAQLNAPDRILQPLKRTGPRGSGQFSPIEWDAALDQVAEALRAAIEAERLGEIVVHAGEAEPQLFTRRVIGSWGIDALANDPHADTPATRCGFQLWMGIDGVVPDLEGAAVVIVVGAPSDLGLGHPTVARLIEARRTGTRVIVIDPRLSALSSMADHWLAPRPGTEAAVLLCLANHVLNTGAIDREFIRRWWNWQEYMESRYPGVTMNFNRFEVALQKLYADWTPSFTEAETGVPAAALAEAAAAVAAAGTRLAGWTAGATPEGNLGGWQVTRCLMLLPALTGAIAADGGTWPSAWCRYLPQPTAGPPPPDLWNALLWPEAWPLSTSPASHLLPHQLLAGDAKLAVYLSQRFNPVATCPDGLTWREVLRDEARVELHVALATTWTETAALADLILPVGLVTERHGLVSAPTHRGRSVAFRQPVVRASREQLDIESDDTRHTNPGQVWEEDELWIQLMWRLDPSGEWGIREHFESRVYRGERMRVTEFYADLFERSVPGLSQRASMQGQTALQYMRRHGCFELAPHTEKPHETRLDESRLEHTREGRLGRVYANLRGDPDRDGTPTATPPPDPRGRQAVGVRLREGIHRGFPTPSGRLEFFSPTMAEWGWPEHAVPGVIKSHVHCDLRQGDELVLIPVPRAAPADAEARHIAELAQQNPLWINPVDATAFGLRSGAEVRVETEIGHFVTRVWVTEAVGPGVVACALDAGRFNEPGVPAPAGFGRATARVVAEGDVRTLTRDESAAAPGAEDPHTAHIWWSETGVPRTLALPAQTDPVSGAACWNQLVRVRPSKPGDRPGDVSVDLRRAARVAQAWCERARPAEQVSPDGTRRPRWLQRLTKPVADAYLLPGRKPGEQGD